MALRWISISPLLLLCFIVPEFVDSAPTNSPNRLDYSLLEKLQHVSESETSPSPTPSTEGKVPPPPCRPVNVNSSARFVRTRDLVSMIAQSGFSLSECPVEKGKQEQMCQRRSSKRLACSALTGGVRSFVDMANSEPQRNGEFCLKKKCFSLARGNILTECINSVTSLFVLAIGSCISTCMIMMIWSGKRETFSERAFVTGNHRHEKNCRLRGSGSAETKKLERS